MLPILTAESEAITDRSHGMKLTGSEAIFPADFAFQLTRQEFANLMFQFGISSSPGGRRKLPQVFTERGGQRFEVPIWHLKKRRKKSAPIERTSRRFPEEFLFVLTTAELFRFDITECDIKFARRSESEQAHESTQIR